MENPIIERLSLQPREVGLDYPHSRFSLSLPDTEHTFSKEIPGLVIGIGDPEKTPPMLVMGNIIYCPTGFGYMNQNIGKQNYFIKAGEVGRANHFPLTKEGEVDQTISRQHLIIKNDEKGQITVKNMGQNGTSVTEVPMIKEMEEGRFYLKRGAVAFDASGERRISLTVGRNNKVELIIGPDGVKGIRGNKVVVPLARDLLNKALSLLRMNPQESNPRILILGRNDINPKDETISRLHLSIIWDPKTKISYLFDHSIKGTIVEFAERQNQSQEPSVREEWKVENVRTPQWILKKVGNPEQQIPRDDNSVGGDYYLFGRQVVSNFSEIKFSKEEKEYLLRKGGDIAVLMDTATGQTGRETPETTTKPFAQKFVEEYYGQIAKGKNPQEAMKEAYETTYQYLNLGKKTEATFTCVTVVDNMAYCLWIGNTEAVVVRKGEVFEKIASKEGMVYESYYDKRLNSWVSPTVLVASGRYEKTRLVQLLPGDKIYVYTDGVKQLNPKNPKKSLLGQDDVVIVEL
jgi:hypothetical protein